MSVIAVDVNELAELEKKLDEINEICRQRRIAFQKSRNSKTMQHSEFLTDAYAKALASRDAIKRQIDKLRAELDSL